jgi:hypothetical protein
MEGQPMFLNCPAYLSDDGAARCGLPAEVEMRYTVRSTDGPLESAKIRCLRGHWFNGPIEFLTAPEQPGVAAVSDSQMPPQTVRGAVPESHDQRQKRHDTACAGQLSTGPAVPARLGRQPRDRAKP